MTGTDNNNGGGGGGGGGDNKAAISGYIGALHAEYVAKNRLKTDEFLRKVRIDQCIKKRLTLEKAPSEELFEAVAHALPVGLSVACFISSLKWSATVIPASCPKPFLPTASEYFLLSMLLGVILITVVHLFKELHRAQRAVLVRDELLYSLGVVPRGLPLAELSTVIETTVDRFLDPSLIAADAAAAATTTPGDAKSGASSSSLMD